jgi:hypothetical protein
MGQEALPGHPAKTGASAGASHCTVDGVQWGAAAANRGASHRAAGTCVRRRSRERMR